jgi:hypothetical protein
MSRETNGRDRRKLGLRRETLRQLGARDLAQVAGGTWNKTDNCDDQWTRECAESQVGTTSRFC